MNREKFCPSCGQKANVEALNFHVLFHDLVHYFTHAEKNIFSLVAKLTTNPGLVAREYLAGKRKKYFSPVNFFLIVAGLLVIIVSTLHSFDGAFVTRRSVVQTSSPLLHVLSSKINWIFFMLVPLFALVYSLFFFRRRYNYVEHLAISLYWQGYLLLIVAFILAPISYTMEPVNGVSFMLWTFVILQCVYYAMAYYQLFEHKNFLYFLFYLLLAFICVVIIFCAILLLIRIFNMIEHVR
ncbi:MAG: DUF3667 domain-containing protein [Chitinophagaceae bacterium]